MFQQCYICTTYVKLAFCYQLIPYICIDIGWCEAGELSGVGRWELNVGGYGGRLLGFFFSFFSFFFVKTDTVLLCLLQASHVKSNSVKHIAARNCNATDQRGFIITIFAVRSEHETSHLEHRRDSVISPPSSLSH